VLVAVEAVARVIATCRAEDADWCASAGAEVALNRQLASGGLRTRIREVLPLARAADAHRMVEARIRGRMVLRP
jgi:hypothetical protein